jgi:structural maintenance of chromosome 3 (chondroitin sulfate proteoglycan 6)
LNDCRQRRDLLFTKRGRSNQFSNKKERDEYLRQEIKSVKNTREAFEKQVSQITAELDALQKRLSQQEKEAVQFKKQMSDIQSQLGDEQDSAKNCRQKLAELSSKRKDLWRQDAQLDASIANLREEYRLSSRAIFGTMDRVK